MCLKTGGPRLKVNGSVVKSGMDGSNMTSHIGLGTGLQCESSLLGGVWVFQRFQEGGAELGWRKIIFVGRICTKRGWPSTGGKTLLGGQPWNRC